MGPDGRARILTAKSKGTRSWLILAGEVGGRFSFVYTETIHLSVLAGVGYLDWDDRCRYTACPASGSLDGHRGVSLGAGLALEYFHRRRFGFGAEIQYSYFSARDDHHAPWVGLSLHVPIRF